MNLGTLGRGLRRGHVTLPLVGALLMIATSSFYILVLFLGPLVILFAGLIGFALAYMMFWRPGRSMS
jgi:hypothetical protein